MDVLALTSDQLYTWLLIPSLIFLARVFDVTLGTVRVIFISRGMKYLAPVVGFFEIIIWLLAIGQIMKNLTSPACYIAYAAGFAIGNFVGIHIAEKLSLGIVLIRIVTRQEAPELVNFLSTGGYGVTSVDGQGTSGQVKVIFTIVPRRDVVTVVGFIRKFNPQAFYSVEEIAFVDKGVFPMKRGWHDVRWMRWLRPFRKGK